MAAEYLQVNLSLVVAIDGCRVLAVSLGDGRVGQVWSVVLDALASNPQANPQVHPLQAEELVAWLKPPERRCSGGLAYCG